LNGFPTNPQKKNEANSRKFQEEIKARFIRNTL
jgi:hypothetical protein